MRRFTHIPADPTAALSIVAIVFGVMCAVFMIRVPPSSAGFLFGLANGVAALALLRRAEWGRRLAIVVIATWISAAAFGLVVSIVQSMYWSHSTLVGTFAWTIGVTLVYAWTFATMMRSDVQCVTT